MQACSNSDHLNSINNDENDCSPNTANITLTKQDYLSINNSEFPYAGIPRIVIETENNQQIRDRETEIPAKLQIWGESEPISEVMKLTIRGRGNSSWTSMPKKSYKIEFTNKQAMLGMPKDRDWALIANYADKSLIKNYLMYQLSAKIGAYYAPRCEFTELYLNKEYLGIYLLTETIKISKNRINIPKTDNSFIVEVDAKYRPNEQVIFSNIIKSDSIGQAFRIHEPKEASDSTLSIIKEHITSFEAFLKNVSKTDSISNWIDIDEYLKHYWIQEFSKNPDAEFHTSVFFSWTIDDLIKMGPVWDFDLSLGGFDNESINSPQNWFIKKAYWNAFVFKNEKIDSLRIDYWKTNRSKFVESLSSIDSISYLLTDAASNNFRKWDILQSTKLKYHKYPYNSYQEAVSDLKKWITKRIEWIDSQIN